MFDRLPRRTSFGRSFPLVVSLAEEIPIQSEMATTMIVVFFMVPVSFGQGFVRTSLNPAEYRSISKTPDICKNIFPLPFLRGYRFTDRRHRDSGGLKKW